FRGKQEEIVRAVLAGQDCVVLMPTGGGKSLTYQLPAVVSEGVTLVVSPLLALIQNQVDALKKLGIKAVTLNSTIKKRRSALIFTISRYSPSQPTTKLLYVTPELMATSGFRCLMEKLYGRAQLARLVVDEVRRHIFPQGGPGNARANFR
ncbi:P-loop containing nucleoside triphosphate hydrolase protein, partial [Blyttiomyces helicus]